MNIYLYIKKLVSNIKHEDFTLDAKYNAVVEIDFNFKNIYYDKSFGFKLSKYSMFGISNESNMFTHSSHVDNIDINEEHIDVIAKQFNNIFNIDSIEYPKDINVSVKIFLDKLFYNIKFLKALDNNEIIKSNSDSEHIIDKDNESHVIYSVFAYFNVTNSHLPKLTINSIKFVDQWKTIINIAANKNDKFILNYINSVISNCVDNYQNVKTALQNAL